MTEFPYSSIIWLTQNKYTVVTNSDYEFLSQWKWYYANHGYAARTSWQTGKRKSLYLHRELFILPRKLVIDHKNGNTLDNRKENLRLCSRKQNIRNYKMNRKNTSGFKGVYFEKKSGSYRAQIKFNRLIHTLGAHKTPIDAAKAYDAKAIELFGEFALTNKMLGFL